MWIIANHNSAHDIKDLQFMAEGDFLPQREKANTELTLSFAKQHFVGRP